ncbi:MAG: 2-hydroxyacid dehydrogenase [Candidatus Bathyarchaeia archaeon]
MASKFKVLVLWQLRDRERILSELKENLPSSDFDIIIPSIFTEDELVKIAVDADVILGMSVSRRIIESAKKLRLIHAIGVGVERIDIAAAAEKGVIVCNTAGLNAVAVAEHAIALLLACAKRIPERHNKLREGIWFRGEPSIELYGKTLGIVGLGSIGIEVAKRIKPFGMRIIAIKRHPDRELAEKLGLDFLGTPNDLNYIMRNSDFIIVSLPATPETRHLIGKKELSEMKPTAFLINVSRGSIIDEETLIKVLRDGKIAGVGLDVFENEPIDLSNPLLRLNNVIVSPHVAGHTLESWRRCMKFIADNIKAVLEGRKPLNVVDPKLKYVPPESRFKL